MLQKERKKTKTRTKTVQPPMKTRQSTLDLAVTVDQNITSLSAQNSTDEENSDEAFDSYSCDWIPYSTNNINLTTVPDFDHPVAP